MSIATATEADLTVTGINNLLLRHYEPRWRDRFECRASCALYYIVSGALTVITPHGEELLTEGDVGIFDAGIPMTLENRGTGLSVSYQISFFADRNPSTLGLPTVLHRAEDLRSRFSAAYEGYLAHGIGYRIRARAAVFELIAALLARETPVMLLDEPTSALDPAGARHTLEILTRKKASAAVAVVTHDLSLAAAFADELILVKEGRFYASGAPEKVLTQENIKAVYGCGSEILRTPSGTTAVVFK